MTLIDAMTVGAAIGTMLTESGFGGLRVVLEHRDPFATDPDKGPGWTVVIVGNRDDVPDPQ